MSIMDTTNYDTNNNGIVDSAEGIELIFNSGAAIQAYSVVSITPDNTVIHCQWPDIQSTAAVVGVSLNTVVGSGLPVRVKLIGIVDNTNWSWNVSKPLFAYYNGLMQQNVPDTSSIKIGRVLTPTKILVLPSTFIALG